MKYGVTVLRTVVKTVEKLPKEMQDRVLEAIAELADTPRPAGAKKLVAREACGSESVIIESFTKWMTRSLVRLPSRRFDPVLPATGQPTRPPRRVAR